MSIPRFARILPAIGLMVSILILFAGPGQSRENDSSRCARFKPVEPNSLAEQRGEAPDAKVIKITPAATKKKPITIEFEHGPGFWIPDEVPVIEDSAFFNVQVVGKSSVLNVRTEWPTIGDLSRSDIDLYLFDSLGSQIAVSNTFNPLPPLNESDGGPGFESVSMPASSCDGFTIESRAFWSAGEDMVLKLWLD